MKEITDPALEYTSPEDRGKCGFCGKGEGGYAKQKNGKWVPACWNCIKPEPQAPQKRNLVGSILEEDRDAEEKIVVDKKKAPGMAPSTYRPAVR